MQTHDESGEEEEARTEAAQHPGGTAACRGFQDGEARVTTVRAIREQGRKGGFNLRKMARRLYLELGHVQWVIGGLFSSIFSTLMPQLRSVFQKYGVCVCVCVCNAEDELKEKKPQAELPVWKLLQ